MSNQLQLTGGAKLRNLEGVLTGSTGILGSVPLGAANGVATLDSAGKVPVSQLPNSVMEFKGTWDAATNTPTLANGTGNAGDVYLCNVAGTVNFGAGPIAFAVGDYVVYSGSTWERSSGATGTVTSVAASITGNSIGITGSPIATAGTLAFAFSGTSGQYINGAGNLTTFPTIINSIGLSMPSAFSVSNSPLIANGTISVTGAGTASQYIRGDGSLATFPSTGGGGSSVYYYLNGSINASVAGYKQMANTAVIGVGTDFSLVGNGLIAEFLTDAGNPNRLLIPSGSWNFEMYFSMSSSGGNQKFYVELLKYDGSTFTSIASTSTNPEEITGGTTTDLYVTSMAVPETTLLTTDRLALRVYIVDNSVGRTSTLHTEDNNLCQIITTFAAGVSSLNGLTANTQYFAVGTSGSDFNISSVIDTHTFNLPTASATKRGALSSTDWSTFNGKQNALTNPVTGTGASNYISKFTGTSTIANSLIQDNGTNISMNGSIYSSALLTLRSIGSTGATYGVYLLNSSSVTNFYVNDAGYSYFSVGVGIATSPTSANALEVGGSGKFTSSVTASSLIKTGGTSSQFLKADGSVDSNTYLTTSVAASTYVPYTGATTGLDLGTNTLSAGNTKINDTLYLKLATSYSHIAGYYGISVGTNIFVISNSATTQAVFSLASLTSSRTFTLPNTTGTLALTSDIPSLSGYIQGTGTTNYVPKFTGTGTIGNSLIYDNGTNVGVNTTTPNTLFEVKATTTNLGRIRVSSTTSTAGNYRGYEFSNGATFRGGLVQDESTETISLFTPIGGQSFDAFSNGNIGIGTSGSNAGYKLDVNGTGRFSGQLTGTNAIFNTGSSVTPNFIVYGGGNSTGGGKGNIRSSDAGGGNYWDFGRDNAVTGDFVISNFAASPFFRLATLTGAATFSSSVTAGGEIGISGNASIALNNLSGTFSQQLQYRNNGTTKFQLYLDESNNSFNIFNSALSTNSFTIKSTGIVNIANVPTSTSGLATGDIYKTVAGVLMIM